MRGQKRIGSNFFRLTIRISHTGEIVNRVELTWKSNLVVVMHEVNIHPIWRPFNLSIPIIGCRRCEQRLRLCRASRVQHVQNPSGRSTGQRGRCIRHDQDFCVRESVA